MDHPNNHEQDTSIPRESSSEPPSVSPTETRQHTMPSDSTPVTATAQRARNAQPSTDKGLKRGSVYAGKQLSSPVEDVDAKIVRESVLLHRRNTQPTTSETAQARAEEETPLFDNEEILSSARLATQYEEKAASTTVTQNKVMTPAQFERYRQQRELTRQLNKESDSESSDGASDYEEDEDEAEKNREAARQRRKQEAHLSVYRQQMMKITGEQNPNPLNNTQTRPPVDRAGSSTPNLSSRMSTIGLSTAKSGDSGKSSDGDDDEDVPLGILAAHGFPNKNRPPTRLASASSIPNLRAASPSPGSVYGEPTGNRSSLPAFARNLPKDPYFGASLVNPSRRESLAMGGGAPAYGGPPSSLPPGGLVGVIASEERARAMRRGSPNPQSSPSPQPIPRPYTMTNMGQTGPAGHWGMSGAMPPQQGMSPGEQAQLQISQQMAEIMQTQVQMMQQMMQMQGMAAGPQGHPNNNFLYGAQPASPNMRPVSMASANSFNLPSGPPQIDHQRTFSMLDPGMSRWNTNRPASIFAGGGPRPASPHAAPGYTPSIAPSERSNVGLASRYRPVSTVGPDRNAMPRSSTFTSSTLKPWNDENQRPSSMAAPSTQPPDRKSTSLANVTVPPADTQGQKSTTNKTNAGAVSDDDDDEGWAEMMKKREKKKSGWKLKNSAPALGDLLHMVH